MTQKLHRCVICKMYVELGMTYLWHLSSLFLCWSLFWSALDFVKSVIDRSGVSIDLFVNPPFIKRFQSFQLNLFIDSNKVFSRHRSDLQIPITEGSKWNWVHETFATELPRLESCSPTSTGLPWWLISRSSSFLEKFFC